MSSSTPFALIADIGGTHARFAGIDIEQDDLVLQNIAVYACADFENIENAIAFYQQQQGLKEIHHAVLAMATPIAQDAVSMVNCNWHFSIQNLKQILKLDTLYVINDFMAQAMCLPALQEHDLIQIGEGYIDKTQPKIILGAGTGLGMASLIPTPQGFMPVPGEGGHTTWPATTPKEWFIQRFLAEQWEHVSAERLLSGPGLENIFRALAAYHQKSVPALTAKDIIEQALTQESALVNETIEQFMISLGQIAGNFALTTHSRGGVYLTGNILLKLQPFFNHGLFRSGFENKGRFKSFNQQIATYLMIRPHPGLLGAAFYLKRKMV